MLVVNQAIVEDATEGSLILRLEPKFAKSNALQLNADLNPYLLPFCALTDPPEATLEFALEELMELVVGFSRSALTLAMEARTLETMLLLLATLSVLTDT